MDVYGLFSNSNNNNSLLEGMLSRIARAYRLSDQEKTTIISVMQEAHDSKGVVEIELVNQNDFLSACKKLNIEVEKDSPITWQKYFSNIFLERIFGPQAIASSGSKLNFERHMLKNRPKDSQQLDDYKRKILIQTQKIQLGTFTTQEALANLSSLQSQIYAEHNNLECGQFALLALSSAIPELCKQLAYSSRFTHREVGLHVINKMILLLCREKQAEALLEEDVSDMNSFVSILSTRLSIDSHEKVSVLLEKCRSFFVGRYSYSRETTLSMFKLYALNFLLKLSESEDKKACNINKRIKIVTSSCDLEKALEDLLKRAWNLLEKNLNTTKADRTDNAGSVSEQDLYLTAVDVVAAARRYYRLYLCDKLFDDASLLDEFKSILTHATKSFVFARIILEVDELLLGNTSVRVEDKSSSQDSDFRKRTSHIDPTYLAKLNSTLSYTQGSLMFVGRSKEFKELDSYISKGDKVIVVYSPSGIGKSTLCRQYIKDNFDDCIEFSNLGRKPNLTTVEELIEEKLGELGGTVGRTFDSSLYELKRLLRDKRYGVLFDNMETVIDESGCFISSHSRYADLIDFFNEPDVKSIAFITSRKLPNDGRLTFRGYELNGLSLNDWRLFFEASGIRDTEEQVEVLHASYDGNAKAMEILRSQICGDRLPSLYFAPVASNYRAGMLEDLISTEIDRLSNYPDNYAYQLLLRISAYRCKEDSVALCVGAMQALLWDCPQQKKASVIQKLEDSSLLDFRGEGVYILHPAVRKEASNRLLNRSDWVKTHIEAANYWKKKALGTSGRKSGVMTLEACYHFTTIAQYKEAAKILVHRRINPSGANESCVRSLYKNGLVHHVEEAILDILEYLSGSSLKAKLVHTLGAISWLKGRTHEGLKYCDSSIKIVEEIVGSSAQRDDKEILRLKEVELNSYLTEGLCYMGLWDIDKALDSLNKVTSLASDLSYEKYAPSALFYIAYIYSLSESQSKRDKSLAIAEYLYSRLPINNMPSWITEYRLYYLGLTFTNLGQQKGLKLHRRVLDSPIHRGYTQAKVKHYNGLACFYRMNKNFSKALEFHKKARDSFMAIGAQYDFAEACFQEAETYVEMERLDDGYHSLKEAISLFRQMKAENQITRVFKAKSGRTLVSAGYFDCTALHLQSALSA